MIRDETPNTELGSRGLKRRLSLACRRLYDGVAGTHPAPRVWHYQWLPGSILYRDLRQVLQRMHGSVLDVGCGESPYRSWMINADRYTGIDVVPGRFVDHVINPGTAWPLEDALFDSVLCTQVIEHVSDPDEVVDEIVRVAKPGAFVVISIPFIYNEHGSPFDFRRLSRNGVHKLLERKLDIITVRSQGGFGSSVMSLVLNWLETVSSVTLGRLLIRTILTPFWLALCATLNVIGLALDRLDVTDAFYGNVLVIATTPVRDSALGQRVSTGPATIAASR